MIKIFSIWRHCLVWLFCSLAPGQLFAQEGLGDFFNFAAQMMQEQQRQSEIADRFRLPNGQKWMVVASRNSQTEAVEYARQHAEIFPSVVVIFSANGRYAILVGIVTAEDGEYRLDALKGLRLIPQDSFLSEGGNFTDLILAPGDGSASLMVDDQLNLKNIVTRIQQALAVLEFYDGALDGWAGPKTAAAFSRYVGEFDAKIFETTTLQDVENLERIADELVSRKAEELDRASVLEESMGRALDRVASLRAQAEDLSLATDQLPPRFRARLSSLAAENVTLIAPRRPADAAQPLWPMALPPMECGPTLSLVDKIICRDPT